LPCQVKGEGWLRRLERLETAKPQRPAKVKAILNVQVLVRLPALVRSQAIVKRRALLPLPREPALRRPAGSGRFLELSSEARVLPAGILTTHTV
jgi:hypothetical protein